MKNKYGIEEEIYQKILQTFEEIEEVQKVVLFGSRAKNNYKATSDIDLAVTLTKDNKKLLLIRKLDEIRCVLKFDVLNIKQIKNEALIQNIQKEGIIIYEKENPKK